MQYTELEKQHARMSQAIVNAIDEGVYFLLAGYRRLKNRKVLNLNTYKGKGRPRKEDYVTEPTSPTPQLSTGTNDDTLKK